MLRRNCLHIDQEFTFEAGGSIPKIDLVYYTSDRDYTPGEKVIWICHALTGNADPEEWWPTMVGEGKLMDPSKYYIVCVSMICSAYGECGPASINPKTGKPYLLDFPMTTIRDIVRANIMVRKHLGIEAIDLLMGPSIGGYQATEWSIMEADLIKNVVFLATGCRCAPYITAYNESQRMALKADPSFTEAKSIEGGRLGLECARSIALISYRSYLGYQHTQAEEDDVIFADRAASYQRYQGEKLVKRGFDAYSYYYLTYALDSMNPGRGRGGMKKAISMIKAKRTVINITTDGLFPLERGERLNTDFGEGTYFGIDSDYGHDGFFMKNEKLEAILYDVLAGI